MNKTVVFITFAVLVAIGIIGNIVIILLKPEYTGGFVTTLVTILGLVTTSAATFYGLGKTNEKLDTVQKQTNGTLSTLLAENLRKDQIIKKQTATITQLKGK